MATATHICEDSRSEDGFSAEIFDSGTMETGVCVTVSCDRCGWSCDELISYEPDDSDDDSDTDDLDCSCERYEYALGAALHDIDHECAFIAIIAHVTEDGYLLGADEASPAAYGNRYWHPAGETDCHPCTIEEWHVSTDVAPLFTVHGTSEQHYSDGYDAYGALCKLGVQVLSIA